MSTPHEWRLPVDADDWQCDWESSRRFQLRYFRSLPLAEKVRAVEEMCRVARLLAPAAGGTQAAGGHHQPDDEAAPPA